jgi:hypothetical protein
MLPLWMALQLATLLLAALQVPLSARFSTPFDAHATAEMAAVQIMAAALLFPSLLKDRNRWLFVAISVWPMLRIAALLGGETDARVYATAAYVTCWLALLAVWRWALPSERAQMMAVAIASLWAIGGPVLLYLRAEYGGGSPWPGTMNNPIWAAAGGPVWGALARLWGDRLILGSDWPLAVLFLAGFLASRINSPLAPPIADTLSP